MTTRRRPEDPEPPAPADPPPAPDPPPDPPPTPEPPATDPGFDWDRLGREIDQRVGAAAAGLQQSVTEALRGLAPPPAPPPAPTPPEDPPDDDRRPRATRRDRLRSWWVGG